MQLYDNLLKELVSVFTEYLNTPGKQGVECKKSGTAKDSEALWENDEKQIILKNESIIELGGANKPAVSLTLYTEGEASSTITDIFGECDVCLYGDDLDALRGDVPYARVTIVGIAPEFLREDFKLYQLFRSIEYVRYHVSPKGYMPRISTAHGREQVRISANAVEAGLEFIKVGKVYNAAYLKHPAVSWAKTVFVTLKDFDYIRLKGIADGAEAVTMSLDHPLNNLNMDCSSCSLKPVCDEADKLCGDGQ
jgi:hypothetical protein